MGLAHSSPQNVRLYYSSIVGPFNHQVVIRDHVFICLDAPSLVDEDYQRSTSGTGYEKWNSIGGGSVEFVKSASIGTNDRYCVNHMPKYSQAAVPQSCSLTFL
jgi:hypothetical protein